MTTQSIKKLTKAALLADNETLRAELKASQDQLASCVNTLKVRERDNAAAVSELAKVNNAHQWQIAQLMLLLDVLDMFQLPAPENIHYPEPPPQEERPVRDIDTTFLGNWILRIRKLIQPIEEKSPLSKWR